MTKELEAIEAKATEIFTSKPYWGEKYNNAPEKAKAYYRLMFAVSLGVFAKGNGDCPIEGVREERDRVYQSLDDEAWDYLLKHGEHAESLGLAMYRMKMQKAKEET